MAISNFNGVSWSTLTKVGGVLRASIVSVGGVTASSVDPDAQAFITAASITDPTQQTAINDLVVGLKTDNLWTNMQAIYPFVGGTATSHKYNLKDPRDLDAAFRLQFFGGMTHNSNGITGNGTNAYAKTFQVNALSIGVYSRSTNPSGVMIGKAGRNQDIEGNDSDEFYAWLAGNQFTDSGFINRSTGAEPYSKFYNVVGKNALGANTRLFIYRNGSQVGLDYATDGWYNNSITYLCAAYQRTNNAPSGTLKSEVINNFSNVNIAFASLSDSILNATQNANLNTRVEAFQTALSRQVIDPDAQAFITAAGITNTTQQNAIDNLVIGLKADGLWTPMQALYPFVGGTASTHKWNLKDPRDLDAAYRLQFGGGVTHNQNGARGNAVNSFMDTYFTNFVQGQIGVYNRGGNIGFGTVQVNNYTPPLPWDYTPYIGASSSAGGGSALFTDCNSESENQGVQYESEVTPLNLGLFTLSGLNGLTKVFSNGSLLAGPASNASPSAAPLSVYLAGSNGNDLFRSTSSNSQLAFGFVTTTALTNTQNTNLYNRVQTFQTALSRNV